MINELFFFAILVVNILLIVFSLRLGKGYLVALLALNLLMAELFAGEIVSIVGVVVTVSAVFYPLVFVMTNIVNENEGVREAERFANIGAFTLATLLIFFYLGFSFSSISETASLGESLDILLSMGIRVVIASILAYLVAQKICVSLYNKMKKKMQGRSMWLRNVVSNSVAQGVDTIIFYPIAFYSIIETPTLLMLVLTGWIVKSLVAAAATPTLYLAKNTN